MKVFKHAVVLVLAIIGGLTIIFQIYTWLRSSAHDLAPIDKDVAIGMIDTYQRNSLRIMHKSSDCSNEQEVISFRVEADVLNKMINRRPFTLRKYDDILIFPAMAQTDDRDTQSRKFTLVFAGVKDGEVDTESFHDYCHPCPNDCPSEVDISSIQRDLRTINPDFSFNRSNCKNR